MNELTVFQNQDLGSVRTINRDGEPWFVANDVCRVLEINNPHMALKRLDSDEKSGVNTVDPHGREQKTNIINESGLYSLILTSRKPQAHAFKRWITHEVIPAIRKTGSYNASPTITIDRDALGYIIGSTVAETVKQLMPYMKAFPLKEPKPPRERKPVLLKDFEAVMRKVIREQGVSGNEISERMNVSKATVSNWRNGKNQPNRENYLRFVMEFNVPVSELGKGVF